MLIRAERAQDAPRIRDLTARAFAPMSWSDGTEAALPGALRDAGDLTLSLVAQLDQRSGIVGHVAFSPLAPLGGEAGWLALGPLSVAPEHQRRGIGGALVLRGLALLQEAGAPGVALTGNPDIYARWGFRSGGVTHAGTPQRFVLWRRLTSGHEPAGALIFAPAFGGAV